MTLIYAMSNEEKRAMKRAILRRDFNAFVARCFQTIRPGVQYVSGWYIEAITHQLELCRLGQVIPPGGALLKWSWFKSYRELPQKTSADRIVCSWDTAWKDGPLNDYTACTVWLVRGTGRDAVAYLQHVYRERIDYPTLKRKVAEIRDRFAADSVLVEDTASGISLIQELNHEGRVYPIGIKPDGDKLTRMSVQPRSKRAASSCPRAQPGSATSAAR